MCKPSAALRVCGHRGGVSAILMVGLNSPASLDAVTNQAVASAGGPRSVRSQDLDEVIKLGLVPAPVWSVIVQQLPELGAMVMVLQMRQLVDEDVVNAGP